MNREIKEVYEFPDYKITAIHNTEYADMFWNTTIKPLLQPLGEIPYHFTSKAFITALYAGFAYLQGLFESETVIELLTVPVGLIEGLCILVAMDFVFGTVRAITDPRIKWHIKKWTKTFNKIVVYSGGIVVITVGANMFPGALGWLQYVGFLVITGNEIWSCLKHLKLTALAKIAWEFWRNKDDLKNWDYEEIRRRVDEQSAKEFAESQAYFFGEGNVEVENKETGQHAKD